MNIDKILDAQKKEKITKTINDFLERNQNYSIEVYIRTINTDSIIGRFHVPMERDCDQNREELYKLSWSNNYHSISIYYDEIYDCYYEVDEWDQQMVHVIMKNGMVIEFECCGMQ